MEQLFEFEAKDNVIDITKHSKYKFHGDSPFAEGDQPLGCPCGHYSFNVVASDDGIRIQCTNCFYEIKSLQVLLVEVQDEETPPEPEPEAA